MTMQSKAVHIAFGLDAPYVPHVGAAVASLVASSPKARLHFTMLCSGVAEDDRRRVGMCAPRAGFDWINIEDASLLSLQGHGHISAATCFRLALAKVVPPDIDRILYLDSDLIVMRDISSLWNTDLHGRVAAAVSDPGVDALAFATRWGLPTERPAYFNAGVLLIDLNAARSQMVLDTALEFLVMNKDALPWHDQDALNYALWRQWLQLDTMWNMQRTTAIIGVSEGLGRLASHPSPAIVHFTTEDKPWVRGAYTPYAWLYWRNLMRTPFREEVEAKYGVNRRDQMRMLARYARRWPFLRR
jgi:lipopolysaccharide biosynthesis glycosyltransferase